MKKLTAYLSLFIGIFLLHACVDDKGNYNYTDADSVLPVQIEGLAEDTTILKGETLKLTPTIINDDPSRYTYSWYIMDAKADGFLPRQWNLSEEKNLEWVADLDVAQYLLNFRIYDKIKDIYIRHEMTVNITAVPMTTGWYVMKDDGSYTDLDYISLEGEQHNDILAQYDSPILGTGVCMVYQGGRYEHVIDNDDGTVTTISGRSAYHILTTNDIRTYDAKDFTLYKTFEDEFYTTPETCRPQNAAYGGTCIYLLNDGKVHNINTASSNIGKFGAAFPGFYDLSGDILPYGMMDYMVFDRESHSFYALQTNSYDLIPINEANDGKTTLSLQNMNYDLQCSGFFESGPCGTIILKSLTDDNYLLLQITAEYDPTIYNYAVRWVTINEIPEGNKLRTTRLIAPAKASNFFYFVHDNKVYSLIITEDMSSNFEANEEFRKEFPGETITAIKYANRVTIGDQEMLETLAVLTSQNGMWRLRIYSLPSESTPELSSEPIAVYEGTGNGTNFIYRSY